MHKLHNDCTFFELIAQRRLQYQNFFLFNPAKEERCKKEGYMDNSLNASGIKWMFAYQLTLIRMRVGKNVGGFIEMRCGCQGMVKAGLSLKF